MIFDADTHMSPYKHLDIALTAGELDEKLSAAGVTRAVCWLTPHGVDDVSDSNRYIHESSKKYPRFVPFGWANVTEGLEKSIDEVKKCMEEYGFRGVKINGAQNYYPIDDIPTMKVCEEIAKRGGVIAFHIGSDEPVMTSPFRAAVVANEFPDTHIVMIHMGGASSTDENKSRSVIDVAKLCPNMVLIGSAIRAKDVKVAIDELGPDRVMFGSDTPFFSLQDCLADYDAMLKNFDQSTREKVMYQNASRVFLKA